MFFHSKKVPPLGYNGKVHVVIGGMYSGKTTELQRIGRRMAIAKKTVLYIKLDKDNRYSKTKVVTHDGIMEDAISCASLSETVSLAFHHDIICIDEGQFFPTLVEYCDLMANVGKTVVVAMLSGTCNRRLFPEGNTMGLIAIAQTVTKLTSVCGECGFDGASYSALIRPSGKDEIKEDGVLIGGLDTYEAMCRRCFMKNSMK
jgi:thymidine kinase